MEDGLSGVAVAGLLVTSVASWSQRSTAESASMSDRRWVPPPTRRRLSREDPLAGGRRPIVDDPGGLQETVANTI
jgi:hypothetical protein